MIEIICTRVGMASYRRYLGPLLDNPPPEIWADAEIDMRTAEDPGKLWWLVVDPAGAVLAQCAAWPHPDPRRREWKCGHNYEHGHRKRRKRYWPKVFAARQAWLIEHKLTATTYIFDQPLAVHLAAGWTLTGEHDISEQGHHWQELIFQP
jgi:hypothetical protein